MPVVVSKGFLFLETIGKVWRPLVVIVRRVLNTYTPHSQEWLAREVEKPCSVLTRSFSTLCCAVNPLLPYIFSPIS